MALSDNPTSPRTAPNSRRNPALSLNSAVDQTILSLPRPVKNQRTRDDVVQSLLSARETTNYVANSQSEA